MLKQLLTLALSALLLSCTTTSEPSNSPDGTWRSIGYGKVLQIEGDNYTIYDITQVSCLPAKEGPMSDWEGALTLANDTLQFREGFDIYSYERIEGLPDLCGQTLSNAQRNDPMFNFEVFAQTYADHYEFFNLGEADWEQLYTTTKDKITSTTSEPELYVLLRDMQDSLNDGHGYLDVPDVVIEAAEAPQEPDADESDPLREYGDFEIAGLVADHFLAEDLTEDSWLVKWGTLNDTLGYIQVYAMFLHADLDLPDSLVQQQGFGQTYFEEMEKLSEVEQLQAEIDGISATMDRVMEDLRDMNGIVIDVRFNGGGIDDVGMEIVRRFNPERRLVATKKARHEESYSPELPIYLEAADEPYTKPVYILTSQQSGSATDIFVMCSLELDHTRRIGSHTMGATSDALQKDLPNGWEVYLSNEVYLDTQGRNYEGVGIPADLELNYPLDRQTFFRSVANDLEQDKQTILHAITTLNKE